MSIVTNQRFTYCSNCGQQIIRYVLELGYTGPICCRCLVKSQCSFPKGKAIYQPCSLCKTPEIHWFCEYDYDCCGPRTMTNCGLHDEYDLDNLFQSTI